MFFALVLLFCVQSNMVPAEFHGMQKNSGCDCHVRSFAGDVMCEFEHNATFTNCDVASFFIPPPPPPPPWPWHQQHLLTTTTTLATHDGSTPAPKWIQAHHTAPVQEPQTAQALGQIAVGNVVTIQCRPTMRDDDNCYGCCCCFIF